MSKTTTFSTRFQNDPNNYWYNISVTYRGTRYGYELNITLADEMYDCAYTPEDRRRAEKWLRSQFQLPMNFGHWYEVNTYVRNSVNSCSFHGYKLMPNRQLEIA